MNKPVRITIFAARMIAFSAAPRASWAQSGTDAELIDAAKKEREVVWYTTTNLETSRVLADVFQKKHPYLNISFYLATIGHCMECHTPMEKGQRDFVNKLGTGGFELKGPWGVSVSRNITSHKEKGIGAWSDAEIKRAITQGVRKDGSQLKPPMGFSYYAHMTDADLDAVVAWLRTVPARE